MIERGAQLDQFRLLFFGRQGCQMQFVVDAQFTALDGFGNSGDTGLGAFDQRLEVNFSSLGQ